MIAISFATSEALRAKKLAETPVEDERAAGLPSILTEMARQALRN
jgi:hypothetical protein